ncbi:exodeoxyribonuclease VII large subunit, partial [Hallella bergensis]
MSQTRLTLFELNSLVRGVLETTLSSAYWVEAELSEAREVRGHCYMELIQKDLFSATPVARASAKCWKTQWTRL